MSELDNWDWKNAKFHFDDQGRFVINLRDCPREYFIQLKTRLEGRAGVEWVDGEECYVILMPCPQLTRCPPNLICVNLSDGTTS